MTRVFTTDEMLRIEAKTTALMNILNEKSDTGLEYLKFHNISTWERDGNWELSYIGTSYDIFSRDVVCEIFSQEGDDKPEPMRIYLVQHQEKRVNHEEKNEEKKWIYTYGEVQRVEPIKGKIINSKWVIRE